MLKMKNGARIEDIKILEQSIIAAKANLNLAKIEYDRHSKLLVHHAVSGQLNDKAENVYLTAKAQLASLEQQLAREKCGARKEDILATKATIEGLKAQLRIAEDQLADTQLLAPFDGMITKQFRENHEMAKTGEPVLSMHDISVVEVPADIPENCVADFLYSASANEYQITFFTLGQRKFSAKLHEWNSQADPSTGTYRFVFRVDQPDGGMILPGMTAELTLKKNRADDLSAELLIPLESLVKMTANRGTVWVVDPVTKVAAARDVELRDNYTEKGVVVKKGLQRNELIVVKGSKFVRAGEPLEFRNPDAASTGVATQGEETHL
ncbi:MAG: efflux RND transporter periplasmic adaptor subunit [Deltaproteobacteria bacterium]|nr:efflux RND transporter periplasmic adaptor subunit [Deltaproteobacteria bacterium]